MGRPRLSSNARAHRLDPCVPFAAQGATLGGLEASARCLAAGRWGMRGGVERSACPRLRRGTIQRWVPRR